MKKLTFILVPLAASCIIIASPFYSCKKSNSSGNNPPTPPPVATIDLSANQQVIRGFGAATVFLPSAALNATELDKLFGTADGQVGLSILRIRLASDDDPNWRSIELANAQGAKQRGAIVMATPWSPPARFKTNGSIIGGSLITDSSAKYATYLDNFAKYMATNNAALYAVSVQNEPDISVTYESCNWTATQMHDFVKGFAGAITTTKVIAPESFNFNHAMSDPILNDDAAAANISIVGGHIYGGGLADYPLARTKGKDVWMTEHLDTTTTWAADLATAKEIHDCLATANFNAYLWWYGIRFYGPVSESDVVTKRGYVMSQFARFIRPGYFRVSVGGSIGPSVYLSAYKGAKTVIVAINMGTAATDQQFTLQNGTITSMTPYTTSQTQNAAAGSAITINSGSFTYTLPAQSITTFVQTP
jgi:glucuronoarabinoxylan endo-1,4-beta-xylanase